MPGSLDILQSEILLVRGLFASKRVLPKVCVLLIWLAVTLACCVEVCRAYQ